MWTYVFKKKIWNVWMVNLVYTRKTMHLFLTILAREQHNIRFYSKDNIILDFLLKWFYYDV